VRGRALLGTEYAGSFLLLAGSYAAGLLIISFYKDSEVISSEHSVAGRPLAEILRSPIVILAISAAALGYGIMSLIMTATPISMHAHAGHSLEITKFVIQSHIAAMYLPSLIFAWLCARVGFRGMMWSGALIYLVCLIVAALNTQFLNYWLSLVLLGIGWNFLFLSGTNLLSRGYKREERFRVQSTNDFLVFSIQAIFSLSSGWFLFHWQWRGILMACIPMVLGFCFLMWLTRKKDFALVENRQA
jgi:MFS family permease